MVGAAEGAERLVRYHRPGVLQERGPGLAAAIPVMGSERLERRTVECGGGGLVAGYGEPDSRRRQRSRERERRRAAEQQCARLSRSLCRLELPVRRQRGQLRRDRLEPALPHAGPAGALRAVRSPREQRQADLAVAGHSRGHDTRRVPRNCRRHFREGPCDTARSDHGPGPNPAATWGLEVQIGLMAESLGGGLVLPRRALVGRAQSTLAAASQALRGCWWEIHHHLRRPFPLVRQFLYDRRGDDRLDQAG